MKSGSSSASSRSIATSASKANPACSLPGTRAAFLCQSEVSGNGGSSELIAAVTDAGYSIKRQLQIHKSLRKA
jgi:hypothetical protein